MDFRRTGTALAGFAVPSASEIIGLVGLNLMNGVEHNHSLGNFRGVAHEVSALRVATPDFEDRRFHFISSTTCFKCSGTSGIASPRTCISTSSALRTITLTLPSAPLLLATSSRA